MGQCLDITLPGALTSASGLPFAEIDPRLNAGSLMLWEPGHPANPFVGVPGPPVPGTGTPIRNVLMPNIADRSLSVLAPSATADQRRTRFVTNYNLQNDGTAHAGGLQVDGLFERTPKGGLHIISSQSTQQVFRNTIIQVPDAVRDYIFANQANSYFLSLWYRVTRADAANSGPYVALKYNSGNARGIFNIGRSGALVSIVPSNNVVAVGARNTVGLVHEQLMNTWDGMALDTAANLRRAAIGFGFVDDAYGDHGLNKSMSAVVYSAYLEDLTVSGQTFAQAAARDVAQRTLAFGDGGRYVDDTLPTDPATIP